MMARGSGNKECAMENGGRREARNHAECTGWTVWGGCAPLCAGGTCSGCALCLGKKTSVRVMVNTLEAENQLGEHCTELRGARHLKYFTDGSTGL